MKYLTISGLSRFLNNLKKLIPSKTSQLTNDSGYITADQVSNVTGYSKTEVDYLINQADSNVVHLTGNETIGGTKTFTAFPTLYYGAGDNYLSFLKSSSLTFGTAPQNTQTYSIRCLDKNDIIISEFSSQAQANGINNLSLRVRNTDGTNIYDRRINFNINTSGLTYFAPNIDNICSLGVSDHQWKSVYANSYYLGTTAFGDIVTHNASEFLTSHQSLSNYVTTDTTQTISGDKTFTGAVATHNVTPETDGTYSLGSSSYQWSSVYAQTYYYNGTAWGLDKANTWTGENTFSSTLKQVNVTVTKGTNPQSDTTEFGVYWGGTGVSSLNNALYAQRLSLGADGSTTVLFYALENASGGTHTQLQLRYDPNDTLNKRHAILRGDLRPYSNNDYNLGTSGNQWKSVYANSYYLGTTAFGDIVTHNASEFLTEHQSLSNYVTTNTAQTIDGAKTFVDSVSIKRSNPFLQIRTTGYVKGVAPLDNYYQGVRFYDDESSNSENHIVGGFETQYITSGYNISNINCRNYDQNNVHLNYSVGLYVPNDSTKPIQFVPSVNNVINLGSSSNVWKSVYANSYYLGTTAFGDIVTHNASEFLTSHQAVSNSAPTLSWGTTSTIGTIGGTALTVKMPANPNTNTTYSAGTGLSLSGTTFSVSSTAGTSTLAWNSEVTLGTVGGLAIKAKLPANPNTDTDTKNTAGSTNTSSKIFLIGATSQAANPQTYSHDTAYVGTDGCLYSGGTKVLTSHQDLSLYPYKETSANNWEYLNLGDTTTYPTGFDGVTDNGRYHIRATADTQSTPISGNIGGLLIVDHIGTEASVSSYGRCTQIFYRLGASSTFTIYLRRGYVTDGVYTWQAWETLAKTSDIPTKTSELTNDSGFLTAHQSLSNYLTKTTNVSEMGRYIDLHYDNATSAYDYDARIYVNSQGTAKGGGAFVIAAASVTAPNLTVTNNSSNGIKFGSYTVYVG